MLPEKLKNWDYYKEKLPLYVRNSYGIKEHFYIIYGMMIELDKNETEICNCFNLLQEGYEHNVIEKYDSLDGYDFEFLDMIASIYGVNRCLNVSYTDESNNVVRKALKLTNQELYTFIKARIIQNNYDGSYAQAIKYYRSIGLNIQMFFDSSSAAKCDIYLDVSKSAISENIRSLFLAGLLTLKSIGIVYNEKIVNFSKAGIWNSEQSNGKWNEATWL